MEIPRDFSSFSRSVSTPVNALTSVVLPWSIWPAVPMIILVPEYKSGRKYQLIDNQSGGSNCGTLTMRLARAS
jgi:hypothetical protein